MLQLLAMSAAMGLGVALSMGPALPVFVKHTGLQLFMLGTVTTHLTVRESGGNDSWSTSAAVAVSPSTSLRTNDRSYMLSFVLPAM